MRVLFLDIDGVLNTDRNFQKQGKQSQPFDPEAIAALNRVLRETDAKIVVSSAWRIKPEGWTEAAQLEWLKELLASEGVKGEVVGFTPWLIIGEKEEFAPGHFMYPSSPRRDEIAAWLKDHPEVTSWVAVDDDFEAGPLNLVLCDEEDGLTDALADEVIEILQTP